MNEPITETPVQQARTLLLLLILGIFALVSVDETIIEAFEAEFEGFIDCFAAFGIIFRQLLCRVSGRVL